jgi:FkbM family methyltransferase
VKKWVEENGAQNIILYGAGVVARNLLQILQKTGLNVIAFSDSDKTKWNNTIEGLPCIPPCDLVSQPSSLIIVTINNHYYTVFPVIVEKLINNYGCKNIVHYSKLKNIVEIQDQMENNLMLSSVELPKRKYYNELENLYLLLGDDISKQVLLDILNERISYKWAATIPEKYMYHPNDLFEILSDDIIVDCGAYTGDTLENIYSSGYSFKKYFAIEPDKDNISKLMKTISSLPESVKNKIVIIPKASGEYCGDISFDDSYGASSHIVENGHNIIPCTTLDSEFTNEKISYIKMDIEGYEMNTLKGAEKIIKQNKPILAISIYHYPHDLWEIPLWINEHFPFYNFHIRNYDSGDIVCYAVPRSN